MAKFSHALSLAFEIETDDEEGEDITQDMLVAALQKRIADLVTNNELKEAVGSPWDTCETGE